MTLEIVREPVGQLPPPDPAPRGGLLLRILPSALYVGRARMLVERSLMVNRQAWMAIVSGLFEPLFYLVAMGIGFGALAGDVVGPGGQPMRYVAFVAPALLAASACLLLIA